MVGACFTSPEEKCLEQMRVLGPILLHTFQMLGTKQLFGLDAFAGWESGKMTLQGSLLLLLPYTQHL